MFLGGSGWEYNGMGLKMSDLPVDEDLGNKHHEGASSGIVD